MTERRISFSVFRRWGGRLEGSCGSFYLTYVPNGVVLHFRLIGARDDDDVCASVLPCKGVCVVVLGHISASLSVSQVHGSSTELLSQADPLECRECLPDTPGHSAPAAPTHT